MAGETRPLRIFKNSPILVELLKAAKAGGGFLEILSGPNELELAMAHFGANPGHVRHVGFRVRDFADMEECYANVVITFSRWLNEQGTEFAFIGCLRETQRGRWVTTKTRVEITYRLAHPVCNIIGTIKLIS